MCACVSMFEDAQSPGLTSPTAAVIQVVVCCLMWAIRINPVFWKNSKHFQPLTQHLQLSHR